MKRLNHVSSPNRLWSALIVCAASMCSAQASANDYRDMPGPGDLGNRARANSHVRVDGLQADEPTLAKPSQIPAQVSVARPTAVVTLSVDRGVNRAEVKFDDSAPEATISLGGNWVEARVTVSRTSDLVGRPIDIFRPINKNPVMALPSRMPVGARWVTSGFGYRTHPILGGVRLHSGIDLAAPYGTPVVATTAGRVGTADWRGGYGLFVAVEHGNVETRYGHMSRLNVSPGQSVRPGDVIGYVGSTGRSTGPHLHYEVRVNGQAVNPLRAK